LVRYTIGFIAIIAFVLMPSYFKANGVASYMSWELEGRLMADGRPFRALGLTAASWTLPLGSRVRVTNLSNGRSVDVTIEDRGPALWTHRSIDLSLGAAQKIGMTRSGVAVVRIERLPVQSPRSHGKSKHKLAHRR
jgi:rare lipoprotein A